jgi:hypothetical protein
VTIEEPGEYMLTYQIAGKNNTDDNGQTTISFTGSDGRIYLHLSAGGIFGNMPVQLDAGNYTLTFNYDYKYDEGREQEVEINFKIVSLDPQSPFAIEPGAD